MKRKQGFTLIELLVVIAIIAILAAILFPVFAKAREKARQTTCLSNEKQIGLAFVQYVQDFDERYPTGCNYAGAVNATTYVYWPGEVYPYVKSAAAFSCPDDAGPNNIAASATTDNGNFWDQESYAMNLAMNTYTTGDLTSKGITLSQINFPSELCLATEVWMTPVQGQGGGQFGSANQLQGFPLTWYSDANTPDTTDPEPYGSAIALPLARHTGSANVIFSDGHVKNIQYSALFVKPTSVSSDANFRLWHPNAL